VSVNSISTWSWNAPPPWQSATTNSATSGPSEFQQLASDVQAVLAQGQTQASSGTATSGASAATNPAQQLATDLQTFAQSQTSQSSSDPAGQPGSTQAPAHHHHHHGGGGGTSDASGTSGTSGTSASSTASSTATASSSGSATGLSQALAGDLVQILQAYGSQVAASTTSPLTTA
jgi:hypothetical protein